MFSASGGESARRYLAMWRNAVIAVGVVSFVPVIGLTLINYVLYQRSFNREITEPIHRTASLTKRSIEFFLAERIAAAQYILSRESLQDLYEPRALEGVFRRMRGSFGGIVDIGIIDGDGVMRAYAGPYKLQSKVYTDQDWFNEALVHEFVVSDVFLGHRKLPHFIVAVKREDVDGSATIFRATIDSEVLDIHAQAAGLTQSADVFIVNRQGVLQTPSRLFGPTLGKLPLAVPAQAAGTAIEPRVEIGDDTYVMGYAYIEQSPFVVVILVSRSELMKGWLTYQREIFLLLTASLAVGLLIIMTVTSRWVERIRVADAQREATLHNVEYTNKMASIGRLAAGVAHEINNPLAIINEKAGLIRDLVQGGEEPPHRDRIARQVESILHSVKRCSDITHRLLGFARRMDVRIEPVALDSLIHEVLTFLEGEAIYRGHTISFDIARELPMIHSDNGQLQQVFLNIITNAFQAMGKGGHLAIAMREQPPDSVSVTITDNGCGIADEDLPRIFEPFFTTKQGWGTGLGLSITYGIVQKLGGTIGVQSQVGQGTTFTVVLPVNQQ